MDTGIQLALSGENNAILGGLDSALFGIARYLLRSNTGYKDLGL
jgi:hypothetical protein